MRIHCLERLEKLSKLRQLNEQNHWSVSFDGIKPGKFYNEDISTMEMAIVTELNNQNPANMIDAARDALCNTLPKCTHLHEYLNITNGHDFIHLFCIVCLDKHSKASIEAIETTIRGTLGKNDFMRTALYANLLAYQTSKNIQVVG